MSTSYFILHNGSYGVAANWVSEVFETLEVFSKSNYRNTIDASFVGNPHFVKTTFLIDAGTGDVTFYSQHDELIEGSDEATATEPHPEMFKRTRVKWFAGASFLRTGAGTTVDSAVVTVPTVDGLSVGQTVQGAGIPINSTIISVGVGQITLSNAATATASVDVIVSVGDLVAWAWEDEIKGISSSPPTFA